MNVAGPWTEDRVDAAEARVERDLEFVCDAVRSELGARLVALVLVGSYARGEGGVSMDGEVRAFNDYDLVVIARAQDLSSVRRALPSLALRCEERCGVSVDLWPISRETLANVPRTLFWYDVALGAAKVLVGPNDVLAPVRARRDEHPPVDEAARLLANRAAGIALSRLGGRWASPLVVARHAHKAVLAVGDALLLGSRLYRAKLGERAANVRTLCDSTEVYGELPDMYDDALAFRRGPERWLAAHGAGVSEWNARVVARVSEWHLRFERWRLGPIGSPLEYAARTTAIYRDSDELRGPRAVSSAALWALRERRLSAAHPRELLARAAVAIAYTDRASLDRACEATLGVRAGRALPALERLVQRGG
ncbi:MAG: nucleotidyltransferase domain-containing protein [Myxococcales bacterium]|nr:nucleotidyltransferase domain-containing protein [Myxococcales bacterium]